MFAYNLTQNNYPSITLHDKATVALQLMDDYDVQHLCIVNNKKFIGIISKNDLLDAGKYAIISSLQQNFIQSSVKTNAPFTEVLKTFTQTGLTIVPVIDNNKQLVGIITQQQFLKTLAEIMNVNEEGAVIILEVDKKNFSVGEINRLVETNDAHITQLNTLAGNENTLLVNLKINRTEVSDIVATFQRYDYSVKYFFGEEYYNNQLQENYNHLISYLSV